MSWCPFFHWVVIFLPASQWNLLEYVIEHLIPFRLHLLNWIGLSETIVLVTSHSYLEFLIVANLMLAPVHVLNDPHFKIVVDLLVWSNRIIGELADLAATSLVENAFAVWWGLRLSQRATSFSWVKIFALILLTRNSWIEHHYTHSLTRLSRSPFAVK